MYTFTNSAVSIPCFLLCSKHQTLFWLLPATVQTLVVIDEIFDYTLKFGCERFGIGICQSRLRFNAR